MSVQHTIKTGVSRAELYLHRSSTSVSVLDKTNGWSLFSVGNRGLFLHRHISQGHSPWKLKDTRILLTNGDCGRSR